MQFNKLYLFKRQMIPVMMAHAPIIVRLVFLPGSAIEEYGGGVLTESDCPDEFGGGHQALIVGHGVEDGLEYWLVRSSWGANWGEAGYVKIEEKLYVRRTDDGGFVWVADVDGDIEADTFENHLNQRQVGGLLMGRDSGPGNENGGDESPERRGWASTC